MKRYLSSTAILVLAASSTLYAEQTRTRTASTSAMGTPAGMTQKVPAGAPPASSEPKSWSEYMRLVQDGGALTGGPLLFKEFGKTTPGSRMVGGSQDLHDPDPFPCGIYSDRASFDADHGPFSRGLGNFEDFELSNASPGSLCVIDGAVVDCNRHGDPSGFFCSGNSLDAGDVLAGVKTAQTPFRGAPFWEMLETGAGFYGTSKYMLPNYFGDTHDLTFPNSATPSGCLGLSPGPNAVGLDIMTPFGSPDGGTLTITLANGKTQVFVSPGLSANGTPFFVGLCCEAEITKISAIDNGGTTIGMDNIAWGQAKAACPVSYPPVTLEDIHTSLEVLELKLDSMGGGGSGDCRACNAELDALEAKNAGLANSFESKRDAACRALARGQDGTAGNIACAFLHHVDAQANKGITQAEADGLRGCMTDWADSNGLELNCE